MQEVNKAARTQSRPVLVYFETEAALRAFKASADFQATFPADGAVQVEDIVPSKMTRDGDTYMEGKLRFAVGRMHVTLLTADHTRGLDLVVSDPQVKEKGVHVIMSYFDLDKTGEIQAMGRTARQSDNGSFCLILDQTVLLEQLEDVGIDDETLKQERGDGKAYHYLEKLRADKYGAMCQERMERVENGSSALLHAESIKYREALVGYTKRADRGDGGGGGGGGGG